jgi:hypothetical protein
MGSSPTAGFSFLSEAKDVPTKTTYWTNGQGGHFNLQAENTTNFNTISNNHMDQQTVNNENLSTVAS